MNIKSITCAAAACAALACAAVPVPRNVPELMTTASGEKVVSIEQWERVRAPELLALFEREEYGRRPAAANERGRVSFEVYDVCDALDGRGFLSVTCYEVLGEMSTTRRAFVGGAAAFVALCAVIDAPLLTPSKDKNTASNQNDPANYNPKKATLSSASTLQSRELRLMSYNIRHCQGMDGKVDVRRVADAIIREKPDFVGLNEVDCCAKRSGNVDEAAELGRLTGLHATFAKTIPLQGVELGK